MGVIVEVLSPGDYQNYPKMGDTVSIHYVGRLMDGQTFDSNYARGRGRPFTFKVGAGTVTKGMDEAIKQMSLRQQAVLTCTPDYAYGSRGFPPSIPPNAVLQYEVELVKIH